MKKKKPIHGKEKPMMRITRMDADYLPPWLPFKVVLIALIEASPIFWGMIAKLEVSEEGEKEGYQVHWRWFGLPSIWVYLSYIGLWTQFLAQATGAMREGFDVPEFDEMYSEWHRQKLIPWTYLTQTKKSAS